MSTLIRCNPNPCSSLSPSPSECQHQLDTIIKVQLITQLNRSNAPCICAYFMLNKKGQRSDSKGRGRRAPAQGSIRRIHQPWHGTHCEILKSHGETNAEYKHRCSLCEGNKLKLTLWQLQIKDWWTWVFSKAINYQLIQTLSGRRMPQRYLALRLHEVANAAERTLRLMGPCWCINKSQPFVCTLYWN